MTDGESIATYQRLLNTWQRYNRDVQRLLLANIRSGIATRMAGKRETITSESCKALEVLEGDNYAQELMEELRASQLTQQPANFEEDVNVQKRATTKTRADVVAENSLAPGDDLLPDPQEELVDDGVQCSQQVRYY